MESGIIYLRGTMEIKFSNGFTLTIVEEAGDKLYKMTNNNKPTVYIEGHCYKFNTKLVYRESMPKTKSIR